jgi:hypothetical protein
MPEITLAEVEQTIDDFVERMVPKGFMFLNDPPNPDWEFVKDTDGLLLMKAALKRDRTLTVHQWTGGDRTIRQVKYNGESVYHSYSSGPEVTWQYGPWIEILKNSDK